MVPRMPFDWQKDLALLTIVVRVPEAVVVTPALGVDSLAEFVAYARANPGKINFASAGTGSITHLAAELLKRVHGGLLQINWFPLPSLATGKGVLATLSKFSDFVLVLQTTILILILGFQNGQPRGWHVTPVKSACNAAKFFRFDFGQLNSWPARPCPARVFTL